MLYMLLYNYVENLTNPSFGVYCKYK